MKTNILQRLMFGTVTLLLAACAQEDMIDSDKLPEGKYPLEIASITLGIEHSEASPWGGKGITTRVSENADGNSSKWDAGDEITVAMDGKTATYVITADGKATPKDKTQALYWEDKQTHEVTAWYPAATYIDLSNQSYGLKYMLKATGNGGYNTPVSLSFSHALSKVKVVLSGEKSNDVQSVKIDGYRLCTINNGEISNKNGVSDINMHKVQGETAFEANVYPGYQITKIQLNNNDWSTLTTPVTPEAARVHTIDLDVKRYQEYVDLTQISGDVYTVQANANVLIDGKSTELIKRIVVKEGAVVELKNVIIKNNADWVDKTNSTYYGLKVENGATINLSGKNHIEKTYEAPLCVTRGTLIINGSNDDELVLITNHSGRSGELETSALTLFNGANLIINGGSITADASKKIGAGIGAYGAEHRCGDITINGGIIIAKGGEGSAGIGCGFGGNCGNITIAGGNITAECACKHKDIPDCGAAGIGCSGALSECGNITITGANTVVSAKGCGGNAIGLADFFTWQGQQITNTCGTITIDPQSKVTQERD